MAFKAVLFDFNGVILNDERLHEELINQILLEENLQPMRGEYRYLCLGRSDRACLVELFKERGRYLSESQLQALIERKHDYYQKHLATLEKLPLFPGLADFILQISSANLAMAVVSGALRSEIELTLQRSDLAQHFPVIVAGDDITTSKPDPTGYLLAAEKLGVAPAECLAIEDTPAGITAAKQAGISVAAVANTYPFHMLQRRANWTVDFLPELELERVREVLARLDS
ncbi:HAD family phosphatase [Leptolyngbya sp. FACHB-261]|uniref:HAD family hydrolase n=1 Tax=Leptolyngbya sp. FACHB-261 TaxID=2692806 RepID=UPI0016824929|nr:HAD family phosphatase [Leptolyngbya sp. FACHB-261]MBD2101469.1 HAD family phosphatase [Leptolyngbya sp. FACHB-261]